VLDTSASMHATEGGKTLFERSRAWAENVLAGLAEGDRVGVLAPGSAEPRIVFPPVSDHKAVLAALRDLQPGFGAAALPETVRDLLDKADGGLRGLEIHLFSDFQKTAWNKNALAALTPVLENLGAAVFLNRAAILSTGDAGLAEALFTPPAIIGNGAFQATATVRTNDHFVGTNIVRLETESGELNHVALDLLPGESRGAGLAAAAPGEAPQLSGCLRLENDAYELNNSFFYSLPRLAGLPALLVNGTGERDTFFLRRALQPGGQAAALMVPTVVSWPEFLAGDISGNAAVMLCNPPVLDDTAVAKLRQYLINGGAVALFPGENDGIQATALQQFPGWKDLALATRENPELARMDVSLLDSHEPLGQRLGAMLPPPWSIPVRRFLLAQPPDRSGVLLHFQQNNGAFIQRCRVEAGALWLCAVSANRDWSDWPMTPFFLVFVQELAREIAGMRLRGLSTVVHTPLPLAWPGAATRVILTITDPLGHERQVNGTRDSGADPLLVDGWQRPGLHTLTDGETTWQIAVNIPDAERDPAGLSSAELLASLAPLPAAYSSDHDQLRRQLTELRQGSPLWPLLLILAFVLSMLEVLFANSRSRAVAQPRLVGELLKQGGRVA
ncbi:MAG: VWA domain-containing protein, partial [Lentisphaeria bacterium]|nr:VWA domain-containing protein [Lentisphaeria bacterium]